MSTVPFFSQLKSLWQAITGDTGGAKRTQEEFLDAWKDHPVEQISDMADSLPIVGHVKGLVHLAMGDTEASARSEEAATRTLAVLGAGALTAGTGGAAVPILAGVAAGVAADVALTGIESLRHEKYDPQEYLDTVHEFSSDWRGGLFDSVVLAVGDAVLSSDGSVTKANAKTTKVFRVEGEGVFLTKNGNVEYGANSRLFPGPGGSVIGSPNIIKLIVPPDKEETRVRYKKPAVLWLSVGGAARAESYYAQKFLQYQDAVEELRTRRDPSTSPPAAFQFKIKSFRILTNDSQNMFRDVPADGTPSPAGVKRVDIKKPSMSFECPQTVYVPLLERAIPDTVEEVQPAWMLRLPRRFLEFMKNHQVTYGCVRTFVIVASKFGKTSLLANIAQKISDQELRRLEHGPISLSILSQQGLDDVEIRDEHVRRLCQSREVKCGRKVVKDVDHGRHMEYLAEFSDGSTFWIPSSDVAKDLKEEYLKVMTTGAKEVGEILNSDSTSKTVTVKWTDGTIGNVDQTKIFWLQEDEPTKLSDAELDAVLHHSHFGLDFDDFIPCTITINTNWASLKILSKGAALMMDPAARKAGEYPWVRFNDKEFMYDMRGSQGFVSRTFPFFIVNNGAPFDIYVEHGPDAEQREDGQGNVVVNLSDECLRSGVDQRNLELNPSTFHIRPMIATPGLLIIESDWGSVEIDSKDATISPDATVDQSIYKNVDFTATSMTRIANYDYSKKVIPFIFLTRDEKIDITIKHGLDMNPGEDRKGDRKGVASALFTKKTYTSPYNPGNPQDNPKSFTGCKVNARPPVIPL